MSGQSEAPVNPLQSSALDGWEDRMEADLFGPAQTSLSFPSLFALFDSDIPVKSCLSCYACSLAGDQLRIPECRQTQLTLIFISHKILFIIPSPSDGEG